MKYKKVICLILCICFLMVPLNIQISGATSWVGSSSYGWYANDNSSLSSIKTLMSEQTNSYMMSRFEKILTEYPLSGYFNSYKTQGCVWHCGNCQTRTSGCINSFYDDEINKTVSLGGWQCYGYARYCFYRFFKTFSSKTITLSSGFSATDLKNKINSSLIGSHFRSKGHSMVYLAQDSNNIYFIDANSGYNRETGCASGKCSNNSSHYSTECKINVRRFSWAEFTSRYSSSGVTIYAPVTIPDSGNNDSSNVTITSYPSKNTITDTNAILWARVDKPSDYEVTKIGIRVRKDGDTYSNGWSRYDTPGSNYVGHAYMYPYYDLNEELNATLTHATKYWLQFYAVVDGTEYWSNEEWFITTGSHSYYGGYEADHPHKYYQKCACGYYYYTGETASLSDCSYCYPILTITFNVNGGYINDSKSPTFHTDSDEFIFLNSNNSKYTLCWKYGSEPDPNGLIDDTTFGLERDGCNFLGWSLSPNGGIVYDKTIPYAPEDIYPDIVNGNATVNLYAVWEAYEHSYTYSWETMPTETENGIFIKLCKNCNSKTEYSIPNIKIDSIIFANNKIECKVLKPDIDPELSYMLATPYCVDGEGVATGFSEDDKYIIHTFENISALTSASEIEIELWFGAGEIPYSCAVLETRKYTFEQICNDISGDSNINAIDMVMLRVKLLGELDLSTGDTNADGMVDARDLVHLKKYISNY